MFCIYGFQFHSLRFFTHMLLFSFRSFFKMNIKDLLPSEGITDDVGANASSFEGYNNRLAEKCGIDCNDAPEGWTNKLKHFVANRKDLYLSKIQKPKKISDAQKAFPLEDGESFYTRLMKNDNADSNTKTNSPIAKQNSYISFSISESTNSQAEVNKIYSLSYILSKAIGCLTRLINRIIPHSFLYFALER